MDEAELQDLLIKLDSEEPKNLEEYLKLRRRTGIKSKISLKNKFKSFLKRSLPTFILIKLRATRISRYF